MRTTMNKCVNYFVVIFFCVFGNVYTDDMECPPANKTCVYQFHVEEVEVVDDKNKITVNGIIPGTPIIVYEGQKIKIHLHNLMLTEATSIHWHGLHQRGTPGMDGVGWISQCPTGPGEVFTYEFETKQKGSYWYHSHVGDQRTRGLYGALIIKENPLTTNVKEGQKPKGSRESSSLKKNQESLPEDKIMVVGDFKSKGQVRILILDGKGKNNAVKGDDTDAPPTQFNVKTGKKYRFRVIHAGAEIPIRVSVDKHSITVIASDGYDIQHQKDVQSVVLNPGERFDFFLTADQAVKNYWIRAVTLEDCLKKTKAILQYENEQQKPTTEGQLCTNDMKCKIVNCPFKQFPGKSNTNCIVISDLKALHDAPLELQGVIPDKEYFLNFAFPGRSPSINGIKMKLPGVDSLIQGDEIGYLCPGNSCDNNKNCTCYHELPLPFEKTVQMVWTALGSKAFDNHPIHLHGHTFYVLKMSFPVKPKLQLNPDIFCPGTFCNNPTWKHPDADKNLNLINPPRKDVLIIPSGGYAVIRIRSDNPGKWFLHCHIERHNIGGMAMVIKEAYDKLPQLPFGFPICQNFYHNTSKDYQYVRKS